MTGRKGEAAFDDWSLVHFACGAALGVAPVGWGLAVLLVVGYEAFEGALRRVKLEDGGLFEYESWPNITVDVLLGLAGYGIVKAGVAPFLPWG